MHGSGTRESGDGVDVAAVSSILGLAEGGDSLCFGDRVTGEDGGADGVSYARGGAGAGQAKGSGAGEGDEIGDGFLEPVGGDGGEDHDVGTLLGDGVDEIGERGVGAEVDDSPSVAVQDDAEGQQR